MKFDILGCQTGAIYYIVEDDNDKYVSSKTPRPVSLDFSTVVNFREQRHVSRHISVLVTLSVLSLFYLVADFVCL